MSHARRSLILFPGPINVYMSKADGDASAYDGSGDWFKVHEMGVKSVTDNGLTWYADNLQNFTFPLPEETPAGQYLLRVEHIALHSASSFGGAQFYISCAQIKVTGSGAGKPSPVVSIPGVYTGHEDSIELSIYYPVPQNYQPPGPAVWPASGSASTSASPSSASSAAATSSTVIATQVAVVASAAPYPVNNGSAPAGPTGFSTVIVPSASGAAPISTGTSGIVSKYMSCGGKGHTGPTACEAGTTCKVMNEYYSQCV